MLTRLCDPNISTLEWRNLNFHTIPPRVFLPSLTTVTWMAAPTCFICNGKPITCPDCDGSSTDEDGDACWYCTDGTLSCDYCDDGECTHFLHDYSVVFYPRAPLTEEQSAVLFSEGFRQFQLDVKPNKVTSLKYELGRLHSRFKTTTFLVPSASKEPVYSDCTTDDEETLAAYWTCLRARFARQMIRDDAHWREMSLALLDAYRVIEYHLVSSDIEKFIKQYGLATEKKVAKKKATTKKKTA